MYYIFFTFLGLVFYLLNSLFILLTLDKMCHLSYLDTQTSKSCFFVHRCKDLTQIKDVRNHVFHQVLVVGGPERWVWPAGESEGGVPAGARQQCMIISLLLWSGFCLGPSRPWPLTSSHSQTTIHLRWSPNSPSISLLFIQLHPLLRSALQNRMLRREGGGIRDETNHQMINRIL